MFCCPLGLVVESRAGWSIQQKDSQKLTDNSVKFYWKFMVLKHSLNIAQ
jgi:hypothetical protein